VTAGLALVIAVCLLGTGLVLEGVRRNRHELSRLGYLTHSGVVITEPLTGVWTRPHAQEVGPLPEPRRDTADTLPAQRGGGLTTSPT
jgi:hypothetical protein